MSLQKDIVYIYSTHLPSYIMEVFQLGRLEEFQAL